MLAKKASRVLKIGWGGSRIEISHFLLPPKEGQASLEWSRKVVLIALVCYWNLAPSSILRPSKTASMHNVIYEWIGSSEATSMRQNTRF